jgi:hypothetical protein
MTELSAHFRELVRRGADELSHVRRVVGLTGVVAVSALAIVGAMASVTAAQAEVVENDVQTIPFDVFVSCANGGAGEVVSGTINLHTLITSTVNGNNFSIKLHFQPGGGSLVGSITGDAYRPTGVTQVTITGSLENNHFADTFVNNFRIIGPGPGNNLLVHETFHVTALADGTVTVFHDLVSVECR